MEKVQNKEKLIVECQVSLQEIINDLSSKQALEINSLNPEETALVVIDVINGFAKEGVLQSDRVKALIPKIQDLIVQCVGKGIKVIAFADNHPDDSPEFSSYPHHCLEGSWESEVVDEIKEIGGYKLIKKKSTNGFIEKEYQDWLKENARIKNIIIVGDCTDICIEQFANTQKAFFNMKNKKSRVIVPINMVDTYELGAHKGDFMNVISLYIMQNNGVEIVKAIQ